MIFASEESSICSPLFRTSCHTRWQRFLVRIRWIRSGQWYGSVSQWFPATGRTNFDQVRERERDVSPLYVPFSARWTRLKNTFEIKEKAQTVLPRARALLVACGDDAVPPDGGLFACGGYHKSGSGELVPIPEILCYDKSTKEWIFLSDIPNLKKLNVFAVDNNVLVISDKVKSSDPNEEDELVAASKYDLVRRKWIMLDGKNVEESKEDPWSLMAVCILTWARKEKIEIDTIDHSKSCITKKKISLDRTNNWEWSKERERERATHNKKKNHSGCGIVQESIEHSKSILWECPHILMVST